MPSRKNSRKTSDKTLTESKLKKGFSEALKILNEKGSYISKKKSEIKEKAKGYAETKQLTDYFRTKTEEYTNILRDLEEYFNDSIEKEKAALENIKHKQEELEKSKQKLFQLKKERKKELYGEINSESVFSKKELEQYTKQITNYLNLENWNGLMDDAKALYTEVQNFINKKLNPSEEIINKALINSQNTSISTDEMKKLKKSLDKNFEEVKKAYSALIKPNESQENSSLLLYSLCGSISKTLTTVANLVITTVVTETTKSIMQGF